VVLRDPSRLARQRSLVLAVLAWGRAQRPRVRFYALFMPLHPLLAAIEGLDAGAAVDKAEGLLLDGDDTNTNYRAALRRMLQDIVVPFAGRTKPPPCLLVPFCMNPTNTDLFFGAEEECPDNDDDEEEEEETPPCPEDESGTSPVRLDAGPTSSRRQHTSSAARMSV